VKKLRYSVEVRLVRGMIWIMGRLHRHWLLFFARVLGFLAFFVDARGRAAALENLRVALADSTTWLQRCRIAIGAYQNFARTFCDLFWARSLTPSNWQQHIEIVSHEPELLRKIEQGSIWVTPHYGNFELSSLTTGYAQIPMHIVAQNFKNPTLTEIFADLRQSSGHQVVPQEGAMIRLIKVLKRQGHVAFLTDLNFKPSQATGAVECFGLQTCVTIMHSLLAQRLGKPIIPAVCEPLADGRYRLVIYPAISADSTKTAQQIAQQVWDVFEPLIRAQPERWMWMYKHWRYLPDGQTDERYPDYANCNKDFALKVNEALANKAA
jgi:lauroyl/myristoyl acyltransferase